MSSLDSTAVIGNPRSPDDEGRLLVGSIEIAREAKQPLNRMRRWLHAGAVRSAVKRGGFWTATRRELRAEFLGE